MQSGQGGACKVAFQVRRPRSGLKGRWRAALAHQRRRRTVRPDAAAKKHAKHVDGFVRGGRCAGTQACSGMPYQAPLPAA